MAATGKGGKAPLLTKGRRDNTDDDAMDCPVCLTTFDDTIKRPRTLPCGHTLCTSCLNGLIEQGQVACPVCRVVHAVPEVGTFPITYTIEALIRRQKRTGLACPPARSGKDTVIGPSRKGAAGLSKTIRSLVQEQEAKVLAAIHTSQEVQAQLDQYKTALADWDDLQQQFEDRLQALVYRSMNARLQVRQEESEVIAKKEQIQQGEQQLHALLEMLRKATTRLETYNAIDDADHSIEEERERIEKFQAMVPDPHTVTTIRKMMVISKTALKAAQDVEEVLNTEGVPDGAVGCPSPPTDSVSTITDRLRDLLVSTLQAEDLRSLTQPVRTLLEAGQVFAAHEINGHSRHAKICHEDGRVYLYSLRDQAPPLGAAILQMDEVVPTCPPCLVFLDLAWPGTARRRVLVRLNPDTPMGRQFVLLCTGQRGPCYANTNLFDVVNKGKAGEWVVGGSYDTNDNIGGPALLPDLDKGDYRESGKAGYVFRTYRTGAESDWNARFGIRTRDKEEGKVSTVFGEVEAGLDVVAAAAHHTPIREVTVVDCGVVL